MNGLARLNVLSDQSAQTVHIASPETIQQMHFENTCACFVCLLVKQTLLIAKAAAYGLGLPRPMELDLGRTVD